MKSLFDYEVEGQVDFSDYFKPAVKEKPKQLVDFINDSGTAQYMQIRDVVKNTCERNKYDMPPDAIERITNDVSVWLLGVGKRYQEYLLDCLKDNDIQTEIKEE
jgi:hypothetical protein